MAANARLVKDWIQYLKNNQIADMQSDPKTGQLKYRRRPNTEDLFQFLNTNLNFGEEKIMSVINFKCSKHIAQI
jgi:hypothetical protein